MLEERPLVSVHMITYNHESFIAQAIEGVMMQQTDFKIQLVIGEDCSKDGTRKICEAYAQKYPEKITLLPSETNLGMSVNYFRTLSNCNGKYIAVCDGDDYWTDPFKLQKQVTFLEKHPDFGMVYSDVDTIAQDGARIANKSLDRRRNLYREGNIFFSLFKENFINTCTVVFRRDLLIPEERDQEKYWFVYDYWRWMMVAMRSKARFMQAQTACYRLHPGGATNSSAVTRNKKRTYHLFHDIILNFDKYYQEEINEAERMLLFRKMMSLLYRKEGTLKMKLQILRLLPRYQPGLLNIVRIISGKIKGGPNISVTDSLASQP